MGDKVSFSNRALTLWEPWASAIAYGRKRIENRSWAPPSTVQGKRIAIHAGKSLDKDAVTRLCVEVGFDFDEMDNVAGHIVCTAEVAGVIRSDGIVRADGLMKPDGALVDLEWYSGESEITKEEHFDWLDPVEFSWILRDVKPLQKPIEARGHQGIWILGDELLDEIGCV